MDNQERAYKVKETFNAASAGYDKPALRFFSAAAEHLAERLNLVGNERVLDVASGTGTVALACARRLGAGHVTGIDLTEGMLEKAREKSRAQAWHNLTFKCMNLEAMDFAAEPFGAASCGFGIFFLPDMESGMHCIAKQVKPGGAIGISSFTGYMMEPMSQMFLKRIQSNGIDLPMMSWKRLDEVDKIIALYRSAGLERVDVQTRQVGHYLANSDEWWDVVWYSGFRGLLNQLSVIDLVNFRAAHLAEIDALANEQGIWLNVEVLISVGHKPLS